MDRGSGERTHAVSSGQRAHAVCLPWGRCLLAADSSTLQGGGPQVWGSHYRVRVICRKGLAVSGQLRLLLAHAGAPCCVLAVGCVSDCWAQGRLPAADSDPVAAVPHPAGSSLQTLLRRAVTAHAGGPCCVLAVGCASDCWAQAAPLRPAPFPGAGPAACGCTLHPRDQQPGR